MPMVHGTVYFSDKVKINSAFVLVPRKQFQLLHLPKAGFDSLHQRGCDVFHNS
jgi:hypothetical protein